MHYQLVNLVQSLGVDITANISLKYRLSISVCSSVSSCGRERKRDKCPWCVSHLHLKVLGLVQYNYHIFQFNTCMRFDITLNGVCRHPASRARHFDIHFAFHSLISSFPSQLPTPSMAMVLPHLWQWFFPMPWFLHQLVCSPSYAGSDKDF